MTTFHQRLAAAHEAYPLPFGLRELAEAFGRGLLELLFPQFSRARHASVADLEAEEASLRHALASVPTDPASIDRFFAELPGIYDALLDDADAIFQGDPAATSRDEVILAYPGFLAIALYRPAHALHVLGAPLLPRLLTEFAHRGTGIDIHPAARIGARFAIDHGTGIVVGETAVLGDRVKLYQGVTLGAASVRKTLSQTKRHPTIGNNVVIYANATILGGDTVVGDDSVIGGNVWLTHSVAPNSMITHREHERRERPAEDLVEFHL
ncbi:MAG TPA: serine O-acetyltransferase [Gemmatimonadales bacterium]|jgi:serine O-acetyltransferase|nr:serine O-acetyltransferase [Gemmatimonadales bacterium]